MTDDATEQPQPPSPSTPSQEPAKPSTSRKPKSTKRKPPAKDPRRIMGTTEMRKKFFVALSKTGRFCYAAAAIDVDEKTVRREMKRDGRFRDGVIRAVVRVKAACAQKIVESADWRASAWYLERTDPKFNPNRSTTPEAITKTVEKVLDLIMKESAVPLDVQARVKEITHALVEQDMQAAADPLDESDDDDGDSDTDDDADGDDHRGSS